MFFLARRLYWWGRRPRTKRQHSAWFHLLAFFVDMVLALLLSFLLWGTIHAMTTESPCQLNGDCFPHARATTTTTGLIPPLAIVR